MIALFKSIAGLSCGRTSGSYFVSFVCTSRKYVHAWSTIAGFSTRSSSVIAWTFAPAVAPLCAIGVAIAIALAQLWPGRPGMFDGKRSVTVGTVHEMSPMSSEPPPRFSRTGPCNASGTFSVKPCSREPSSFCSAFASV
jgi:hypothetical protein